MRLTPRSLVEIVSTNPANEVLLRRLPDLDVPQCHITAGCLFQTVWNHRSGQAPAWGIRDYDVFYFDEDPSWQAEDRVIRKAARLFADLDVAVEVRNQARVHVWYERRFGIPCPRLRSARDGIDRFLIAGTAVGIEVGTQAVHAPYGFDDLAAGLLRINPRYPRPTLFEAKARDYRERWPWLRIAAEDA